MTVVLIGLAIFAAAAVWLRRSVGFTTQRLETYSDGIPFDVRRHLNGPMICEGVLYGPLGHVAARFVADFDARWDGNAGHMNEVFKFQSGTVQNREWQLTTHSDGRIEARADDVVGVAFGRQHGSAMELRYRLQLPDTAGGHVLDVVDWMYVLDNGTIVNRNQMRKFGIKVAELVATIRTA